MYDFSFYKGKTVLVTGHTGFKGSYLTKQLLMAGARVIGYALKPEGEKNLFTDLKLPEEENLISVFADIRDFEKLQEVFKREQPEIVFHLAAQPIVRTSYEIPRYTYETNVMGTVNVLECIRLTPSVKSFLNITTDKVYENRESGESYRESDRLDGYDPYSNSKSCSELVTHAYVRSFLAERNVAVSTARAGNVIGGGDYSKDRILPDAVRAAERKEPLVVRNPHSTRPYQFVLEPLFAYLLIGMEQEKNPSLAGAYNIGPDEEDILTTGELADLFCASYGEGASWKHTEAAGPHEASLLSIDPHKFLSAFRVQHVYTVKEAVEETVYWTKAADKKAVTEEQIRRFALKAGYQI